MPGDDNKIPIALNPYLMQIKEINQSEPGVGSIPFGTKKVSTSGCGAVTITMVLDYYRALTDKQTNAAKVRHVVKKMAAQSNVITLANNTNMTRAMKKMPQISPGFVGRKKETGTEKVNSYLGDGVPVIVSTRALNKSDGVIGYKNGKMKTNYKTGGHFIVLTGFDQAGHWVVVDPALDTKDIDALDPDSLKARYFYIIEKDEEA